MAYDPEWAARFLALRHRYQRALYEAGVRVVASTSISTTLITSITSSLPRGLLTRGGDLYDGQVHDDHARAPHGARASTATQPGSWGC